MGYTGNTNLFPITFPIACISAAVGHHYYNNNLLGITLFVDRITTNGGPAQSVAFYYLAIGY